MLSTRKQRSIAAGSRGFENSVALSDSPDLQPDRVNEPYGLDRLLIFSRRKLEHVLRVYTCHYNRHRPHRSLAFRPPERADSSPMPLRAPPYPQLTRRDLLGGLIHEYDYAA
jgi:hypothetical protein